MVSRHHRRVLVAVAVAGLLPSLGAGALISDPGTLAPQAVAAPSDDRNEPDPGDESHSPTPSPTTTSAPTGQPTGGPTDDPADGPTDDPTDDPTGPPDGGGAGELLWEADPRKGADEVFQSLEEHVGSISVADDPKGQFGQSFRYEIGEEEGKDRCESKGQQTGDGEDLTFAEPGKTYYVGWRSLWDPMSVDGGWVAFWQVKHYGAGEGGGPLALRTIRDGKLNLQYSLPDGGDEHIWSTDLKLGEWQSFVVGFKLADDSSDQGWLEFWYNGEQQKFTNGEARYPVVMLKPGADYVTNKWGVYRSGNVTGDGTAYLNSAKVGTSYESVFPEATDAQEKTAS